MARRRATRAGSSIPGPRCDAHLDAVRAEVQARGGAGGIALTHDHADHADGVAALRERLGGPPVAAMRYAGADVRLADGDALRPAAASSRRPATPSDHLAFVAGPVCFTGDAVLGEGSVFVAGRRSPATSPALRRLRAYSPEVLCPGHGPPVWEPRPSSTATSTHRLDRERRLLAALADGVRDEDELLDRVWDDAPAALRPAAAVTLAAHLEKLRAEGRL